MILDRQRSHLLIIDVQQRLAPAIHNAQSVITGATRLLRYADMLGIPVTLTEHAPQGIGHTLDDLQPVAPSGAAIITKQSFSAWREPAFHQHARAIHKAGCNQIVLAGMETHVCVMQTALDLIANDFSVYLVINAVGSRTPADRDTAVRRLEQAGAVPVTHEMVAFEWLERGDTAEFKKLLPLIK